MNIFPLFLFFFAISIKDADSTAIRFKVSQDLMDSFY